MATIAKVTYDDGLKVASVRWVEEWEAYATETRRAGVHDLHANADANGPYDTAEEAAAALADELEGKVDEKALDAFVARCAGHDEQAA